MSDSFKTTLEKLDQQIAKFNNLNKDMKRFLDSYEKNLDNKKQNHERVQ